MKISNEVLTFLRSARFQELLSKNDFDAVYAAANTGPVRNKVGELTALFYEADINPLNYMDEIPGFFLFKTNIKSFKILQHITSIGGSAFYYCSNLTSVIIGNSVTSIGEMAFSFCKNLTNITIPDSVTSISEYAFWNCSNLKEITYKGTVAEWRRIKKAGAFDSGVTAHCTNGDLQLQNRGWVKL